MALLRRTVQRAAPPQVITPPQKAMRRVWRAGKPKGDYWYVEAMTREGAINFIARQFKEPGANFDSPRD